MSDPIVTYEISETPATESVSPILARLLIEIDEARKEASA